MSDPCRPRSFDEIVGQERARRTLQILCKSAIKRNRPIAHTVLLGGPGIGKTTCAKLLAEERGVNLIESIGSALTSPDELTRLLLKLTPNDILFIDEVHRMPAAVEEQLYPALEDGRVAAPSGGAQSSSILKSLGIAQPERQATMVDVAPFTLVAASTLSGMISAPLRSRCQIVQLVPYTTDELRQIIFNAARRLNFDIGSDSAEEVARRSRSAARNAIQNLKWLIEFCTAEDVRPTVPVAEDAFELRQIDKLGLTLLDHGLLSILRASSGPVGLSTIAVRLGESEDTLERTVEPYLLQRGYVERTPKGRILGPSASEVQEMAA